MRRENNEVANAMAKLQEVNKRLNSEKAKLKQLAYNLGRENNDVVNAMAKLQEDNKRLNSEKAELEQLADNLRNKLHNEFSKITLKEQKDEERKWRRST
jgi:hypothetical protein